MSQEVAEFEKQVAGVWQEVLGLSSMPSDMTFFEAGGTSLLAARLACRLETALQRRVSAADLFVYPTPRDLARALHNADEPQSVTPGTRLSGNSCSAATHEHAQDRASLQRGAFASFRPTRPGAGRA